MTDVTNLGTILGVWAHPDDEAYLMGGVMAAAVDAGERVVCVTATLGDAGETADPSRWPQRDLRAIRLTELRQALEILGVREHENLDLPDGRLADLDHAEHVDRLARTIDALAPDTIITFGPDGMTGHPDHVTISRWVDLAHARSTRQPRLLHATKTPSWAARFADVNDEVFPDAPPPQVADHLAVHVQLDDEVVERKVCALEAHASQTTALIAALGRKRYTEWVRDEYFAPVAPT